MSQISGTKKPVLIVATAHERQQTTPGLDEGFDTIYLAPITEENIREATEKLSPDAKYAIIGLGEAVRVVLNFVKNDYPAAATNLATVIGYYPPDKVEGPFRKDIEYLFHCIATPESHSIIAAISGDVSHPQENVTIYTYSDVKEDFAAPSNVGAIEPIFSNVARGRTVALLRKKIGPPIDLEAIYDERMRCNYMETDVDKAMEFMVPEPYFNGVPICVGGFGSKEVRQHFIGQSFKNYPPSLKIKLISRTVGSNRIVDEMYYSFTHDRVMDWVLPGIEATGKHCEFVMVIITEFRGELIKGHQLYWDQASLLVQLGLIEPKGLPVVGVESAQNVLNQGSVKSNKLISG